MEKFFIGLLNMSINAGWLILAVLVLRLLLRKAPRRILCFAWAMVGFRLICPLRIESIFSLIPSAEPIPKGILLSQSPAIDSGVPALNSAVNPVLTDTFAPRIGDSVNPLQIVSLIAAVVWAIGVCVMIAYAGVGYFRIRRKIAKRTEAEHGVYLCKNADTPFIFGTICPKIILPSGISDADRVYVLAHERAHLKRGDHFWKILGYALLSVYWFHPLIWVAYILFCRDIEAACDERVIAEMGEFCKKPYSEALVNCSVSGKLVTACPTAFGETGVKQRIRAVLGYKKPALWFSIAAAAVCVIVGICFITDPIGSVNDIPGLLIGGSKWVCTSENADFRAEFVVLNNGPLEGMLIQNGEERRFCIAYREGYAEFYDGSAEDIQGPDSDTRLLMTSGIRALNGKLVFKIKEDRGNIGVGKLVFERVEDYSILRTQCTMEEAAEKGWLVLDGLTPYAGTEKWEQFVKDTHWGHGRTIYIYQTFTDPLAEPSEADSYYIKELVFDGSEYRLTLYDRDGDTGEEFLSQKEYKYLIHSIGPVLDRGESDCYLLSDDPNMTEEKYFKAMASSQIGVADDAIRHTAVISATRQAS